MIQGRSLSHSLGQVGRGKGQVYPQRSRDTDRAIESSLYVTPLTSRVGQPRGQGDRAFFWGWRPGQSGFRMHSPVLGSNWVSRRVRCSQRGQQGSFNCRQSRRLETQYRRFFIVNYLNPKSGKLTLYLDSEDWVWLGLLRETKNRPITGVPRKTKPGQGKATK